MNKKKEIYLYDDSNGNPIWGDFDDYFAMKGYSNEEKPKKKPFWKIW